MHRELWNEGGIQMDAAEVIPHDIGRYSGEKLYGKHFIFYTPPVETQWTLAY